VAGAPRRAVPPGGRQRPGRRAGSDLDLLPLLEKRIALDQARETMAALYDNDAYAHQLQLRGQREDVMLGYSDAGKDVGFLASKWVISTAHKELARLAKDRKVDLRFFHGRGGSHSRRGGPADRVILASRRARPTVASRSPSRARSSPASSPTLGWPTARSRRPSRPSSWPRSSPGRRRIRPGPTRWTG
jgi:hypothetical protein